MRILTTVFLSVFFIASITSCSKDKDPVSVPTTEFAGKYVGKYGTGNNTPSVFFSFNLKQNGTLEELDETGEVIGTGAWSISGNTFHGTSHYIFPLTNFFALTANYEASKKKLTGTWGYGNNDKDGGKWYMTKQ